MTTSIQPSVWLNYHHLLYFWTVVQEGGVSKAAAKLRLAQPTVSAQVRLLEEALGDRLFVRQGRAFALTDTGRIVFRHADEIFGIGRELIETLRGLAPGRPQQLVVGVANSVPKLIVCQLLRPIADLAVPVHLVCREDSTEQLLTQLALHALDVVITDRPAPPHVRVKVFNHPLGKSETAFFAPTAIAAKLRRRFPKSLEDVPMVLPSSETNVRRDLNAWFTAVGVRPKILGEFEDTALMKAFAHDSGAVFPAPHVIAQQTSRLYSVGVIGCAETVGEEFFAISAERRVKHPGVLAITNAARTELFDR